MQHKMISIVIPVHNEQDNLRWQHENILSFAADLKYNVEVILVDDGSTDDSLQIIKELCASSKQTHFISLSRNFGKEAATSAGIAHAKGDALVIMDADGQHPIELLKEFITNWEEGYEVLIGVRTKNRGEGFVKRFGSKSFYWLLRFIGGKTIVPGSTDFRLIDRKVVDQFKELTERNRVTRDLIDWLGYKRKLIPFEANERHAGKATYSTRKLFSLAINGIVSHSTRPLKFIALIGLIISTLSGLLGALLAIETYILGDPLNLNITGVALLALFVTFLVGVVLVCQGLLALYLESVYYEAQNRPLYVIRESK